MLSDVQLETFILPAGEYYIGDPSYVLDDDEYLYVIQQYLDNDTRTGTYNTSQGRKVFIASTYYGDGVYPDNDGDWYPVDAGIIGATPADCVTSEAQEQIYADGLVASVTWQSSFNCFEDDGMIVFGDVEIDTKGDAE